MHAALHEELECRTGILENGGTVPLDNEKNFLHHFLFIMKNLLDVYENLEKLKCVLACDTTNPVDDGEVIENRMDSQLTNVERKQTEKCPGWR